MTVVLASFDSPCVLCAAKADHTIEVCDKRAARFAPPTTAAAPEAVSTDDICGRCAGTGQHISHVLNGRPVPSGNGICFRCKGKGHQTSADRARNTSYDEYAAGKALAADMAIPATIVAVHEDGPPCPHCGATTDHTVDACGLGGVGIEEYAEGFDPIEMGACFGRSCGDCADCLDGAQPDPMLVYGTPEHEAWLMHMERTGDWQ